MRCSTLKERREFYQNEFRLAELKEWFENRNQAGLVKFEVIIGSYTHIFPTKYQDWASTLIIIDEYKDLDDVRAQILRFLPESVYYDRNVYNAKHRIAGQELVFDLDPENLICPVHGTLADKLRRGQGLSFCELELEMVKDETIKLYEELEKQFSKIGIVYSGRGFHIHVFDEDTFLWKRRHRRGLASDLKKKGFLIDEWITAGSSGMELIRLPYSLHGVVSRIVLPLDVDKLEVFDPIHDSRCVPEFLR